MKIKIIVPSVITLIVISIFALTSCLIFSPSEITSEEILPSFTEKESTTAEEAEATSATESTAKCIKDNISDQIKVINPQPNQLIQSPLIVEGEARGTWFFEATFPVKLLDSNGNIIASHYAEAQGEWMTEDFVPFIAQIEFEKPQTDTGVLLLEKDNPSGLPEKDATFIHVRFN